MSPRFPSSEVQWRNAVRIIRSLHPPVDLFEDIADPARLAASYLRRTENQSAADGDHRQSWILCLNAGG